MSTTTENARITFRSEYDFGMDDKRRVQIPAKWRPAEGVAFLVLLWRAADQKHPCLMLLPPQTARKLDDKLEAMPFGDPKAEALRRLLMGDSDEVTVDSAGRICLPDKLAGKANLGKKVMLVGLGDRFQIWNPEFYGETRTVDEVVRQDAIKMI